jgi:hypothetical protein
VIAQLQQSVSDATDNSINQYTAGKLVDDINEALDDYSKAKKLKDAVDAYKNDKLGEFAVKNVAAAVYEGAVDRTVDAVVPKNGDPVNDSMNTFQKTLGKLFDKAPTLSGAVDKFKQVFKDVTGNAKSTLDCLGQMIKLDTDRCSNNSNNDPNP